MPRAIINGGPASSTTSLKSAMKSSSSAEESVTAVQLRGKVKGLEANVSALEEQLVQKEERIKQLEAGLQENLAMLADLEHMDQTRSIKSRDAKKERKKEKKKEELVVMQSKLKEETLEKEQLAMQLELAQKRTEDLEQHVQLQLQFLQAVGPKDGQQAQALGEQKDAAPIPGNLGGFVREMEIVSNLLQEKIAAVKGGKETRNGDSGRVAAVAVTAGTAAAVATNNKAASHPKQEPEPTMQNSASVAAVEKPSDDGGGMSTGAAVAVGAAAGATGAVAATGIARFFGGFGKGAKQEESPKTDSEQEEPNKEEPQQQESASMSADPSTSGPSTGVIVGAAAATGAAVVAGGAMIATAVKKPKKKKKKPEFVPEGAPPLSEDRVYINAIIPKTKGSKLGMKLTEAADSGRDLLIIANILPGGLADESKLKQGMILYTVNGKLTEGKSAMEVARMLAGAEGTVTVVAIADKNEIEEESETEDDDDDEELSGLAAYGFGAGRRVSGGSRTSSMSRDASNSSLRSIREEDETDEEDDDKSEELMSKSDMEAMAATSAALAPAAGADPRSSTASTDSRRATVAAGTVANPLGGGGRRPSYFSGMAKLRRGVKKIKVINTLTKKKVNKWASALRRLDPRYQILSYFDEVAKKGAQSFEYCNVHTSPDGICTQGCLTASAGMVGGTGPDGQIRRSSYFANDEEAKTASSLFNKAGIFTVWRPTSLDSIRKMMVGDGVGKGLDIKGKSAKKGHFSGFVPFLQLHQERHKTMTRTVPKDARMRIFYKTEEARREAHFKMLQVSVEMLAGFTQAQKVIIKIKTIEAEEEKAEMERKNSTDFDVDDFTESKTDMAAREKVLEERDRQLQAALEKYMWEMDDPIIYLVDEFAPKAFGLDIPQRIVFEAYVIRGDCSRPPGSIHETGRGSEPAFQDMNMDTLRTVKPGAPRPVCVLQSEDLEHTMDPRYLLMAYQENGVVKPVVSDFDCFLVGSRRVDFDKPLPADQVELMKWCISVIERILDLEPSSETWTMRWLEELKREYESGFHVSFPKYGFADPTSYSMMAHAVDRLKMHGSVRHGAECFNYYFPQDLDDEFLVVTSMQQNGPWVKYSKDGLLEFLSDKIDQGFMFPVNPKWALCDVGWKKLYDKQMQSDNAWTIKAMNAWYPKNSGVRDMISRISAKHPKAFQVIVQQYKMENKVYSPLRQASEDGEEVTGDQAMDMALLEIEHDRMLKKAIKAVKAIIFANRMKKMKFNLGI